jgi:hypothetical protein
LPKLREILNESIKKTWGDKDWRKANAIYKHHNNRIARSGEGDTGFSASNPGIKGKIARGLITLTAPLGRKLQALHRKSERGEKLSKLGTALTNHTGVVDDFYYHYNNIHIINKALKRRPKRRPKR